MSFLINQHVTAGTKFNSYLSKKSPPHPARWERRAAVQPVPIGPVSRGRRCQRHGFHDGNTLPGNLYHAEAKYIHLNYTRSRRRRETPEMAAFRMLTNKMRCFEGRFLVFKEIFTFCWWNEDFMQVVSLYLVSEIDLPSQKKNIS